MNFIKTTLCSLILLCSSAVAEYVAWGAGTANEQLGFNVRLIQRLELLMTQPEETATNFDTQSKRYKILSRHKISYPSFKRLYNPENQPTSSVDLSTLFERGTLNTEKNHKDTTTLKNYAYKIFTNTGEIFCFYALPHHIYCEMLLDTSHLKSFLVPPLEKEQRTSMTLAKPKVTFFGSCRLNDPLYSMHAAKKIIINNGEFTQRHYGLNEAIQMHHIATGKLEIPKEEYIGKLIWRHHIASPIPPMSYAETDIFMIEACTLKEFTLDGYALNHSFLVNSLFNKYYRLKGKRVSPLKPYLAYITAQAEERAGIVSPYKEKTVEAIDVEALIGSLPIDFLDEHELYILRNVQVSILSEERFIERMQEFMDLTEGKPVIFTSHINVKDANNDPVFQRELIDIYVRKGAKQLGQHYFRPADLIMRNYGQDNALKSAADINHYQDAFLPIIGAAMLKEIKAALN